jgi:type I restriction enzyme S subunit
MFAKEAERWSYGITSDMWSLRPEHFKMIYSVVPPLDEQVAIIRFLYCAERLIRRYHLAKQQLIKLLEEEKQAIIHRAVTRGLDPHVHLKPSGVEWLGDVPEHWDVRQLGRFITLQRGFDITKEQQIQGDVPVVSSGGVSSYHNQSTSPGPGVIVGRKGSVGTVHYLDGPFWAHDTTLWVKTFGANHPRFVYYVLCHLDLKRFDTGSSNPTINRNIVHPEIVPFPPPEEQRAIASFLDGILDQTRRMIDNTQREIELLREYRTRLIVDVVTGKLDVRKAAERLPDELAEPEPLDELDDMLEDDGAADGEELEAADAA